MESENLISPVVSANLQFKKPTTFADEIQIVVTVVELTSAKLEIGYEMKCQDQVVCIASSVHCFVDANGRPVSLKRVNHDLFELLSSLRVANQSDK